MKDLFQELEKEINQSSIDDGTKKALFENILNLKEKKINLMITGATGAGKSSTINALFNTEVAKVGVGVDPETMDIKKYELKNLTLWDTPGLGDGKEKDNQHAKAIIKKLHELDSNDKPLIDLVLVILDGSSRDLGTSYQLINEVIIPALGDSAKDRVLVAINQADQAMKGRNWDYDKNQPNEKLVEFLDEKVLSVKNRINEGTGVNIEPIYYSAGYKEETGAQNPYNLSKLMYFIVKNTPTEKRLAIAENMSKDSEMWRDNDDIADYNTKIKESFIETVMTNAANGAAIVGSIGAAFGPVGKTVGTVLGTVMGGIWGGIKSIF